SGGATRLTPYREASHASNRKGATSRISALACHRSRFGHAAGALVSERLRHPVSKPRINERVLPAWSSRLLRVDVPPVPRARGAPRLEHRRIRLGPVDGTDRPNQEARNASCGLRARPRLASANRTTFAQLRLSTSTAHGMD